MLEVVITDNLIKRRKN